MWFPQPVQHYVFCCWNNTEILAEWPITIRITGKQQELCSLPYSLPPLTSPCLLAYLFRAAAEDLWWCCLIQTRSKQLFTSGLPMGAISKRQAYTHARIFSRHNERTSCRRARGTAQKHKRWKSGLVVIFRGVSNLRVVAAWCDDLSRATIQPVRHKLIH